MGARAFPPLYHTENGKKSPFAGEIFSCAVVPRANIIRINIPDMRNIRLFILLIGFWFMPES
jgi:hypothetical protein